MTIIPENYTPVPTQENKERFIELHRLSFAQLHSIAAEYLPPEFLTADRRTKKQNRWPRTSLDLIVFILTNEGLM